MLLGLTVFIVMFLVSWQMTSACNCIGKPTAGDIELTYSEKRCLCCYVLSTRTNSSIFFYKNGILICKVKDSGQFPWRFGSTTCRKLSGSSALLEIDPIDIVGKWRCGNDSFSSKDVMVNVQDSPVAKTIIKTEYSTNEAGDLKEHSLRTKTFSKAEISTHVAHYIKEQWANFSEVGITSIGTYNSTSSDNSTSNDRNWVIPLHVSLVSFVLLIVVVIILIVLVMRSIMHRIKQKRYERALIERRENEERYITLPRPISICSSSDSHQYESFENLAMASSVILPSRTRTRNVSSVVAEIPKVTHLSIRYNSTVTTAQYQDGENVDSQTIQYDQRSNINDSTTYSSDHSDHSQVNVCIRKFPKNAFQDPILNDGYLIPRAGSYHDMPLYMASNPESTLEVPRQTISKTRCQSVVLQTQTVRLKKSEPGCIPTSQEPHISSNFTELCEPAQDYQSDQTQTVQMPLLETAL